MWVIGVVLSTPTMAMAGPGSGIPHACNVNDHEHFLIA